MFGKSVQLFKLLGFSVKVDLSWLVIVVLVIWSLAGAVFPQELPNRPAWLYLVMGSIAALGLFASIVIHETEPLPRGPAVRPAHARHHALYLRRRGGDER